MIIESIFIIGVIGFILASKPVIIAPISGNAIYNGELSFKLEGAKNFIIAREKEFINPIELGREGTIRLPPGTYYWKIKGLIRESQVQNFTVENKVELKLDQKNGVVSIYNIGTDSMEIKIISEESQKNTTLLVGQYLDENISEQVMVEGARK